MKWPIRINEKVPFETPTPDTVRAGEYFTMALSTPVPYDIAPGKILSLTTLYARWMHAGFSIQSVDPEKEGYVAANGDGKPLQGTELEEPCSTKASFIVPEQGLKQGQSLNIIIGKKSKSNPGVLCTTTAIKTFLALVLEDEEYGIEFESYQIKCVSAFPVRITGSSLDTLRVYAPSQVEMNKPFSVCIRPQDRFGNVAPDELIKFSLKFDGKNIDHEINSSTKNTANTVFINTVSIEKPGIHTVTAVCSERGVSGESNPIEVFEAPQDRNIFWGLIHEHTELSDGEGPVDECYANLRYGARMDFGACGDHDHVFETTEEMWKETCRAAREHNEDGAFVALPGYEWAKWRQNGDGDRNVYYFEDDQPMFRSEDGQDENPPKLFNALKDYNALVIPHHTAFTGNFCDFKDHDPEKERLIEIYSVWGSSENSAVQGNPFPVRSTHDQEPKPSEQECGFVQRALALGWRVGFTAGGDMHLSHPGDDIRKGTPPLNYKTGITGVWAKELTRKGIWDALRARRTFATTSTRAVIDFKVNEHCMGEEFVLKDNKAPRTISFRITGCSNIARLDLVRNNKVVFTRAGLDRKHVRDEWIDTELLDDIALPPAQWCDVPFVFYYLRVLFEDREMAWASPVWILKS